MVVASVVMVYFVSRCEVMFSTERRKVSKCNRKKYLLEITFASDVKPSIEWIFDHFDFHYYCKA